MIKSNITFGLFRSLAKLLINVNVGIFQIFIFYKPLISQGSKGKYKLTC